MARITEMVAILENSAERMARSFTAGRQDGRYRGRPRLRRALMLT
jgi:hypothetical protein